MGYRLHRSGTRRVNPLATAVIAGALLLVPSRMTRAVQTGTNAADAPAVDYLPDIPLVDQYGHNTTLASFKGKPALVGFIHTSCGGVCQMLTAKMKSVADSVTPPFGAKLTMITITTDPKEDGPTQLTWYAKAQGATDPGWVFLTGKPENVATVLRLYGVPDDPDDALTHVFELRLIGANGAQLKDYKGSNIKPSQVAADLRDVLAHRD
ncbi:MAG TPA: SCO family protein [Candidatus Binataceae bacterium]|jgi:cytochrome oxidase Cu insertion factor (SCO1/SenC/PrrC family)|nr:SCO family protein [Candidatus Binataceae bacterium]